MGQILVIITNSVFIKKIAMDKQIDLTQPEYNSKVIKKLYKFKGGM
jgi:hypothetical protein